MFKARHRTIATAENLEPGTVVVLLGTALKGPVMEPIAVSEPNHARRVFGEDGTLLQGYRLAFAVNPNASYFLLRLNGSHARLTLSSDSGSEIVFRAINAGAEGNLIYVSAGDDHIAITGNEGTNYYSFNDLTTVNELIDKINTDANVGYSLVEAETTQPECLLSEFLPSLTTPVSLQGGDDGYPITKNQLYKLLNNAYKRLEGYRTDIIVPLGACLNDNSAGFSYNSLYYLYDDSDRESDTLDLIDDYGQANFAVPLMNFCARQTARGLPAHGVLGMLRMPDLEKFNQRQQSYIHDLIAASCLSTRTGFTSFDEDISYFVSAVLADLPFDDDYVNAAPAYAALLAGSGTETTTRMGLPGFTEQRTELDGNSMRLAAEYGIVTLRTSLADGHLVVYSGVTLAESTRPFHYISNVRTVQYIIARLYEVLDPFVGAVTGTIIVRDMLEKAADRLLQRLVQENVIQRYSLVVDLEQAGISALHCVFRLTIRPKYSLEDINIAVRYLV